MEILFSRPRVVTPLKHVQCWVLFLHSWQLSKRPRTFLPPMNDLNVRGSQFNAEAWYPPLKWSMVTQAKKTDQKAAKHVRRILHTQTNLELMIYLICQAVFEGSSLGTRGENPPLDQSSEHRLEWSVAGKKFTIESPRVQCTSINDGSLFWKEFSPSGEWITKQSLAYCSIEVQAAFFPMYKNQFTEYSFADQSPAFRLGLEWAPRGGITDDRNDVRTPPGRCREAKRRRQCWQALRIRQNVRINRFSCNSENPLIKHLRSRTFLISVAQRTMFLKVAVFTPEYIRHFFRHCLVLPRPPLAEGDNPFDDNNTDS